MSFVALGGDGSTRPTFFELVAAERLMPSLKAATVYSLSVRLIVRLLPILQPADFDLRDGVSGVRPKEAFLSPIAGLRG